MGWVMTINKKEKFVHNKSVIASSEYVEIEGESTLAETKMIPENILVQGFTKYKVQHHQKYKICGRLGNRDFNSILRTIDIMFYTKESLDYGITIGKEKGLITKIAFERLNKKKEICCILPVELNLVELIPKILNNDSDVYIAAGWFSKLGLPYIDNVMLTGNGVNNSKYWKELSEHIQRKCDAVLSNIELCVITQFRKVGISLSKQGFLYTKSQIDEDECLEVICKIINLIDLK